MQFKTHKLLGLETKPINIFQAAPRAVPEGLFQVPFLGLINGARGQGKTTALLNMIKMYDKTKTFDTIYVFSRTWYAEPKYTTLSQEGHFYDLKAFADYTDEIFKEVWGDIKARIDAYKDYERKLKIWEDFQSYKGSVDAFDPNALLDLYSMDFEKPVCPTKSGQFPETLIVFDDLLGTTLYSNKTTSVIRSFTILHRHCRASMLFLTQTFRNGLPRGIRNNLSLALLFANKSEEIRKEIAREFSAFVREDAFLAMWDTACTNPWDFFTINFDAPDPSMRFRKNFDTLLIPEK